MASPVTPRASGFWADEDRIRRSTSAGYFAMDGEDVEAQDDQDSLHFNDERTNLDKTIDRIGMGSYQWVLLSLCGFGWMADNMWLQALAIVLPRVQQHYTVADSYIGIFNSSMFAGMMFGAIGWGTCSDLIGRSAAFNATLFFTALFGVISAFSSSFAMLCVMLFFLGSAIGGSMPTDGTLLLEHMPQGKRYLVTALSVFFSIGAVVTAFVALIVLPRNSCTPEPAPCIPDEQNKGWQYVLGTLGVITLFMFICRIVFFRLHESPRYLVHAGRPREALESLQMIAQYNNIDLSLRLHDVEDTRVDGDFTPEHVSLLPEGSDGVIGEDHVPETLFTASPEVDQLPDGEDAAHYKDYRATSESPSRPASPPPKPLSTDEMKSHNRIASSDDPIPQARPRPTPLRRIPPAARNSRANLLSRRSSMHEVGGFMQRYVRKPLTAWLERVAMVLSPEWARTTLLVWAAWLSMSLAYTMFNVYLPKLLETGAGPTPVPDPSRRDRVARSLTDSLWDIVIFTLGGCPGAIIGAYMVETSLGRRLSLAGATFASGFFCFAFANVDSAMAIRVSTVGINLCSTVMYAVLYGWTPEIFDTKVRGTACGIASALSRIGGMVAPLLGGGLLSIDRAAPVYASGFVFLLGAVCVVLIRVEEKARRVQASGH